MEKLLDIDEISELLGVTKATIYSWTSQNKIPHIKLSKRLLKFREKEVTEWIEEKAVNADTPEQVIRSDKGRQAASRLNQHDEYIERIIRNAKKALN